MDIHPDRVDWRPETELATLTSARTLAAAIVDRARREPDAVAYYLPDQEDDRLTVRNLYESAQAAGHALAAAGIGRGDPVCLCLDTSSDLLAALFGAALLGAVPMLAEPPLTAGRRRVWLDRIQNMVTVAGPKILVCEPAIAEMAEEAGIPVLCPPFERGEVARPAVDAAAEDPAFIQFTSGTTSNARGIVHSQRSLFAAAAAIGQATPFLRGDLAVSWLPLHHDMGLVGSTLSCFLHDIPSALVKPLSFGMKPVLWPRLVHRYRGTLSPAPNFSYQLVTTAARPSDLEGLDLSCWRVAYNGAEVVDAGTIRAVQRTLGPLGFRPETMRPCYGMAEIGLAVSFSPPGTVPRIERLSRSAMALRDVAEPPESAPDARDFVSSGCPLPGIAIRIVGDGDLDLPEGKVGTVLIAGASMMTGYLGSGGQEIRAGWLDTGDRGFMLGGELFVTGRAKDLIIIAGRNYQPQPFELAAATVAGVRPGGAAAIGRYEQDTGTERLVIVVETKYRAGTQPAENVRTAVEQAVVEQTGVRPSEVIVVKPGSLPRTSSWKIQRRLVAGTVGDRPTGVRAG